MRNSINRLAGLAAFGAALTATSVAGAATFSYSTDFSGGVGAEWAISAGVNSGDPGILGQLGEGPSGATLGRSSVGASAVNGGTLAFDLLGFRTLDGFNCCTDTLNVIINGVNLFQGTFALGGGGGEGFTGPGGTTVSGSGLTRTITIPFTAIVGLNTFQFYYPSLQGFGDEAFGLDNVSLRAEVSDPVGGGGGVPEPATWAMMLMGFFGMGSVLRARRRTAFAA